MRFIWLRLGAGAASCKYNNELYYRVLHPVVHNCCKKEGTVIYTIMNLWVLYNVGKILS
jgi:hypothetical protein